MHPDRVTDPHGRRIEPRDRPLDHDEAVGGVHLHDEQPEHGDPVVTHVPRHLLPLEHPPGRLAVPCGAVRPMGLRHAVRSRLPPKSPSFHGALKSLPDAGARDIDKLASLEVRSSDLSARLEKRILCHPELLHEPLRSHSSLGRVEERRSVAALQVLVHGADLHASVPLRVLRLHLKHVARLHLEQRQRVAGAPLVPEGRHAHFLGDDTRAQRPLLPPRGQPRL
mmetsp:Transcript_12491/g.30638  ORF Transcript_12491/g.30638 Transcript_12491/m.30638 type:complete len:224 (+) Transcript_12491:144-815(+)